MGCLGNLLWFIFGGFVSGISWLLVGCFWFCTCIGTRHHWGDIMYNNNWDSVWIAAF